ncbi:MAG: threonylcarbamoyl-AMP synthase [Rhodospirillaceae bacterium]|nr:threonylcarbamoyl-AMP synthase [Rhodospirillaceae bacterium]MBT5564383.1 threonylcarbamoyl-AMP synthase [Rhodospirillaceae bacterium]MBT6090054.1 threonylcarbamoyl-AMP synthase [Rhodospirillaceae bacterium]MBT6959850.1 threonylcarbamoyl-AMP synthase [Rhodospirillaceae bacterium]MBT7450304.1 threonylcarbamoyl-AMP synthase [Rhodospirillaceae bacterium]
MSRRGNAVTIRLADEAGIAAAVDHLRSGQIVAFPTETVYGLGADATQDAAVSKVFAIKGRPAFNPLIVHVAGPSWIEQLATPDHRADALTEAFWPGPLTLVLQRRTDCPISKQVSASLDTIAVRQPDHPVAAALLAAIDRPLAAPSANPSGHVSPTTAEHVAKDLGDSLDIILDGGPCRAGLESTVLDLTTESARILRPGVISADALAAVIGDVEDQALPNAPISAPGQLAKHYAPSLPVRLNADAAHDGEAFIAFGGAKYADFDLSPSGDLTEAASTLFAALRKMDNPSQFNGLAIAPIPDNGIGLAINDRLRRAAKGR